MPVSLILSLLAQFGPSAVKLIDSLIAKWQTNGIVTVDEWNSLKAALSQTAADRMRLQLVAAGIDPASPQGVALLALVQ
jgi:hypothetical protein